MDAALDIGSALTKMLPHDPHVWLNLSFWLHELQRTAEARDNLLAAIGPFPEEAIMQYNLACYNYRFGRLKDALGNPRKLKLMALDDSNFESVWADISEI